MYIITITIIIVTFGAKGCTPDLAKSEADREHATERLGESPPAERRSFGECR